MLVSHKSREYAIITPLNREPIYVRQARTACTRISVSERTSDTRR